MSAFVVMALAATPTWQDLSRADLPGIEEQLGRLSVERRAEVHGVLDAMAKVPATSAGVTAAWKLVTDALPGLEKKGFAGSGEGPNRSALRRAGTQVLRGLVRAAAKTEDPKTLRAAISALPNLNEDSRTVLLDEVTR